MKTIAEKKLSNLKKLGVSTVIDAILIANNGKYAVEESKEIEALDLISTFTFMYKDNSMLKIDTNGDVSMEIYIYNKLKNENKIFYVGYNVLTREWF